MVIQTTNKIAMKPILNKVLLHLTPQNTMAVWWAPVSSIRQNLRKQNTKFKIKKTRNLYHTNIKAHKQKNTIKDLFVTNNQSSLVQIFKPNRKQICLSLKGSK